jgi:tetratricopeptide (TPR) repeat protein
VVDIFLKWDLLNEAEELLINADKLKLLYPGINYKLAKVMMKQRKFEKAISYLRKDLKRDPENLISMNDLGLCFQELRNFEEALSIYNKSLRKKSDNVDALHNKMKCQIELRQLDAALKTCHKILKLQPSHSARKYLDALAHGERPAA